MSLTRADVEKVSLLGRLLLSEAELDTMTTQLARVVGYVEQLSEVNTDGVQPMAHAVEMHNVFRDDALGREPAPRRGAGERPEARQRVLPRAGGAGRVTQGRQIMPMMESLMQGISPSQPISLTHDSVMTISTAPPRTSR